MSEKNFASYGDMETLVTEIASKYAKKSDVHNIPSGGTTGQVLAKSSDTDYATNWVTLKNSRVVELSETNIQTEVGTAKTVTVKYRVAGSNDTATYTSSDTSVATVAVTGHSSTGTSATDVITITPVSNGDCTIKIAFANEVGYDAEYDYINVTVGAASGGSSVKKTRYTITASSWSASANSDGYYTYTVSLSPAIKSSPTVYLAGDTASTGATDTQKSMYALLDRCRLSGSSVLVLYAKTKHTSNFYIYVEGEEGSTSDSIEGTIVPIKEENVYSLGEREIGTWFGAPYYRKCFEYSQAINPNDTIYISDSIFADPSKMRRLDAMAITAANASGKISACPLPYVARSGDATKNCGIQVNQDGSNVMIFNGSAGQTYTHVYIIVEYVK